MKYVYGNRKGQGNEEHTKPKDLSDKNCTIQKCNPDEADRYYLNSERNSLMLLKVPDIRSKGLMIQQPVI